MERIRDLGAHFPHVYGANTRNPATKFWKRFEFSVNFTDAGVAGGTDVDYRGLVVAPFRMMVLAAYVTAIDGNVVAAAAYKTINVENWGRTGAAIVVATVDTSVTGLTQYVPRAMTLSTTLASLIVERGEILEVDIAPTGGGVAINQCGVTVIAKAIE